MPAQFCPFCGTSLGGIDAAFCPHCGRQLSAIASSGTPTTSPQPSGAAAPPPPQPPSYAPPPPSYASPQQPPSYAPPPPSYAPQPAPGAYAPPPPAPPYAPYPGSPAAPAPQYAVPGTYASPPYVVMVPQYAVPVPAGPPLTQGRAIGVTAAVAAIGFGLALLASFSNVVYDFVFAVLPWVFVGVYWLAISRLVRYTFWRVVGECAAFACASVLVLSLLDTSLLGYLDPYAIGFLIGNALVALVYAAGLLFAAVGLAWGFAGWPRLRTAQLPVSTARSVWLPAGVTVGAFVASDLLIRLLSRSLGFGWYQRSVAIILIFYVLPVVAIAVLGGLLTYKALRAHAAAPAAAAAPAPAPAPVAPPPGPR